MEFLIFKNVCQQSFADFVQSVPNPKTRGISYVNQYGNRVKGSTGNMAFNASKIKFGNKTAEIYVDQTIAPYVPYTNEEWLSPKWNGKKNPNKGWFEHSTFLVAKSLANLLDGRLIKL